MKALRMNRKIKFQLNLLIALQTVFVIELICAAIVVEHVHM